MLSILIIGMLLTALTLGVLWGGFRVLRQLPRFKASLNNRTTNKRMLQLTLFIYFAGIITTVAFMAG